MRPRRRNEAEVRGYVVHVNAVPGQQFPQIAAVNHRQRIEPENAGQNAFGLDIGQTAGRNGELLVTIFFRHARAGCFDVAHGQPEFLSQRTKALTGREHDRPPQEVFDIIAGRMVLCHE